MIINWPLPEVGDIDTRGTVTVNKLFIIDSLNKAVTPGGWQTFIGPGYVDIAIYNMETKEWVHKQAENLNTAAFYWEIGQEVIQIRKLIEAESITGEFIVKNIAFKNRKLHELELTRKGERILHFIKNKKIQVIAQDLHEENQPVHEKIKNAQARYLMNESIKQHKDQAKIPIKIALQKYDYKQVTDISTSDYDKILSDIKNWKPEGANG